MLSYDLTPRSRTLSAPVCLEQGKVYTIRVDFNRYSNEGPQPEAQILVDSVSKLLYFKLIQSLKCI